MYDRHGLRAETQEGTGKEIGRHRNAKATMDVKSYEAGQDKKRKKDNESGGNRKESPRKEVEMIRTCDEKKGTLRRKERDGNESTGEKEERERLKRRWLDRVRDDMKEKGLLRE